MTSLSNVEMSDLRLYEALASMSLSASMKMLCSAGLILRSQYCSDCSEWPSTTFRYSTTKRRYGSSSGTLSCFMRLRKSVRSLFFTTRAHICHQTR